MKLCPQCGIRWQDASLGRCGTCVARDSKPPAPPPAARWPATPASTASAAPTTPPGLPPPPAPPPPSSIPPTPVVPRASSSAPPPMPATAFAGVPHTPVPRSMSIDMPEDDLRPISLTQVTGMGALGFHGVPERVPNVDVAALKLTPFEGYLLSLVDGATYADDVVAASGLSTMDAATAFKRLKELGVLRFRTSHDADAAHRNHDGTLRSREADSVAATEVVVASVELHRIMEAKALGTQEDHTVHLQQANAARGRGDLNEARAQVKLAWVIAPDDSEVQRLRDELESPARAQARAQQLGELAHQAERAMDPGTAARLYRQALDEHEPLSTFHHRLALCLLQAGLGAEEAEKHLRRTLELEPGHGGATRLLERLRSLK